MPFESRINDLRLKVRAPVAVRGTARRFSSETPGQHYYLVAPLSGEPAGEFLERLHATLNAAIDRAIDHSGFNFLQKIETPEKIREGELPKLCFYSGPSIFPEFEQQRKRRKPEFGERQKTYRQEWEWGLVKGKKKRTFREIEMYPIPGQLLFEVELTKEDYAEASRQAKQLLKTKGHDFETLRAVAKQDQNHEWKIVLDALKTKEKPQRTEAGIHKTRANGFLIGEVVRPILMKKALARIKTFAEKLD